jgi:cell fate regulator YaaT (PSP1 superfamily)
MKYLYHVRVAPGLEYDCIGDESLHLNEGDSVIVKCERYQDFATILKCRNEKPVDEEQLQRRHSQSSKGRHVEGQRVPEILRRATLVDRGKAHENEVRSKSMHRDAIDRIAAHGLGMKLINTHCSFDRRLVVFQFSADGRVDFRELLRDLSHQFRTRVELRQVGVRDEAAIQGGIGSCGRAFCCATFLKRFMSINVKMAKQQGLSLNPTNISGACGRLKCCLQYEAEWYRQGHDERSRDESHRRRNSSGDDDNDDSRDSGRDRGSEERPQDRSQGRGQRSDSRTAAAEEKGGGSDDDRPGERNGGAARPAATPANTDEPEAEKPSERSVVNGAGKREKASESGDSVKQADGNEHSGRRGRRRRGGRRSKRKSGSGSKSA